MSVHFGYSVEMPLGNMADVKQKIPAIAAAIALWATGVYPPWKMSYVVRDEVTQNEAGSGSAGDHPAVASAVGIASMSTSVDSDWLLTAKALPGNTAVREPLRPGIGFSVDYGRLVIEWAIIAALYKACTVMLHPASKVPYLFDGNTP